MPFLTPFSDADRETRTGSTCSMGWWWRLRRDPSDSREGQSPRMSWRSNGRHSGEHGWWAQCRGSGNEEDQE